jgi:hypothetical protein
LDPAIAGLTDITEIPLRAPGEGERRKGEKGEERGGKWKSGKSVRVESLRIL